jgi:hypothetical protein
MLEQIESGHNADNLKMNVLQAIHYIIRAWNAITDVTISNCWQHTQILSTQHHAELADDADDLTLDDLDSEIKELHLPNAMQAKEFLNISNEEIVYEIPEEDHVIDELVDIFKKKPDEEDIDNLDEDEVDDSNEIPAITVSQALQSIETVRTFLFQNENSSECVKFTEVIEKFIREKKYNLLQQTSLDQYFQH